MKWLHKALDVLPRGVNTALVLAAVLYLTLFRDPVPESMKMPLFDGADKIVHALMFTALAFMALTDAGEGRRMMVRRTSVAALCSAFGGLTELLQHVMSLGRTAEWADFASDTAGSIIGVALAAIYLRRVRNKSEVAGQGKHES